VKDRNPASWRSEAHLRDLFRRHGWKLGCRTAQEHDASAQATLFSGRYFRYFDETSEKHRIVCYDRMTGRFMVLMDDVDDDEIVSHFPYDEWYIRRLPDNTHDDDGV
jgi:hypothetical protein